MRYTLVKCLILTLALIEEQFRPEARPQAEGGLGVNIARNEHGSPHVLAMKGIAMQERSAPRRGGSAFIWPWGLGVGAILGLTQFIISLLSSGLLKTILDLLVWLIGFFLIGLFAARQTGRIRTGTLTGLVTGLSSGLIGAIFGIMQLMSNGPQITPALNQAVQKAQQQGHSISSSQLQTIATVSVVVGLIVAVIIELCLGAGIGALGGLMGRRQVKPISPTSVSDSLRTPPPFAQPQPPQPPDLTQRQE